VTTKADRTRRDIVAAAIDVWSASNAASLGEVADSAGVGRTTLNRYFRDRSQLLRAVDDECRVRYETALSRARPDEGTGLQALVRMSGELLQLGPVLGLIFADNAVVDPDTWLDEEDNPLVRAMIRGYRDGSLDPDLPGDWIGTVVWTSLFAGHLVVRSGTRTSHEAAELLARTLTSGVARPR
jgi:AcrR family transcriptional regulator